MPIRDEFDPQSSVQQLEQEWFEKAEMNENELTRFIDMKYSDRPKKTWFIKKDLENPKTNLNDIEWVINHEKYVNRPDAISYKFYGNSKYWWLIALRNNIINPFYDFHLGKKLLIPDLDIIKHYLKLY